MFPLQWAERALYAGLSSAFLNTESVAVGVGNGDPASVGAFDEMTDSARDTNVTGGGLHRS